MAKFVFTLDGVLKHRLQIEREKQRDLAMLQQQMTALQHELKALNERVQTSLDQVREQHMVGKLDVQFITGHRRYVAVMQAKGRELVHKMQALQRHVIDAQRLLAEAAVNRKAIEKLREQALERWKGEQSRQDAAQTDEIGMQLDYSHRMETTDNDVETYP